MTSYSICLSLSALLHLMSLVHHWPLSWSADSNGLFFSPQPPLSSWSPTPPSCIYSSLSSPITPTTILDHRVNLWVLRKPRIRKQQDSFCTQDRQTFYFCYVDALGLHDLNPFTQIGNQSTLLHDHKSHLRISQAKQVSCQRWIPLAFPGWS